MARKKKQQPLNPLELRASLGINQSEFWAKVGVTQSGGSRYENGRNPPVPVQRLLYLVFLTGAMDAITAEQREAFSALKR